MLFCLLSGGRASVGGDLPSCRNVARRAAWQASGRAVETAPWRLGANRLDGGQHFRRKPCPGPGADTVRPGTCGQIFQSKRRSPIGTMSPPRPEDAMRPAQAQPVRLADYQPPDWLVETVELDVSL